MNVHIWRYRGATGGYAGYHLSADPDGCAALLAWLHSRKERPGFPLQPVTPAVVAIPGNGRDLARCVACTLFQLHVKSEAARDHFRFTEISGGLSLECSPEQMDEVIRGVKDVQQSKGDCSIGGEAPHVLWFWWYPALGTAPRPKDATVRRHHPRF